MCGIAGFCDFTRKVSDQYAQAKTIAEKMGNTLTHRGPNDSGTYIGEHVAFAHTRLAVIDLIGGAQPMVKTQGERTYTVVYNGELYNTLEIKQDLLMKGYHFTTQSDTEVLLTAYIEYGENCVEHFNGIFAFAIWDSYLRKCFLCRDRFGVKPLFYSIKDNAIVFASEIKGLFQYPGISPIVNQYGLCELFGLGPARSPGCGVYEGINEVMPGYAATIDYSGMRLYPYWTLKGEDHEQSYEESVEKTRELLIDSISRQLVSDVPICTLLSGGVDSSVVSAIAANVLREQGKVLDTYSFDYYNNSKYFKASKFQPSQDRPYVDIMQNAIASNHTYLECGSQELYDYLFHAVRAKDLPGMVDVDSSMLYFCRKVKEKHTVCLSGECADEIFGGYPWFRDEDAMKTKAFPWSKDLSVRKNIMSKELLSRIPLDEYVNSQYEKTIARTPCLLGEEGTEKRRREISYLNITWFMTTLLDRKDRTTMASGLEVRVPFADHRLVQYVYNVPWKYKYHNEVVKSLLRDSMKGLIPDEVLYRKKSPYPKTYDPAYENLLKVELNKIIDEGSSPLLDLIDLKSVSQLLTSNSDYGKPWFGQLMATPQMFAYLIEIDYWLKHYGMQIKL